MSGARIHKPGCIANKYWGDDFPPCNCEELENEELKETIKMIRSVCVDYKEQPSLGLVAIETLCKGVSGGKRKE